MHKIMATKTLMVFNLGWLDFKKKGRGRRKETRGRETERQRERRDQREREEENGKKKKRKYEFKNQLNLNSPFPKSRTDWMRERQNPQVKRFPHPLMWVRIMTIIVQLLNTPTEIYT